MAGSFVSCALIMARTSFSTLALGFGPAFGKLVQADFMSFKAGFEQGLESAFTLQRELETMPGRRSQRRSPHIS